MKRSILLPKSALWLIAVLTFASCSQDELADGGQDAPLPAGKYPLTLTVASLAGNAPTTRSTVDNKWNGEKVSVQGKNRQLFCPCQQTGLTN